MSQGRVTWNCVIPWECLRETSSHTLMKRIYFLQLRLSLHRTRETKAYLQYLPGGTHNPIANLCTTKPYQVWDLTHRSPGNLLWFKCMIFLQHFNFWKGKNSLLKMYYNNQSQDLREFLRKSYTILETLIRFYKKIIISRQLLTILTLSQLLFKINKRAMLLCILNIFYIT